MLAWIGVCISPVVFVYNNLLRFRTRKIYEINITPQVGSLQKLLNDQYDVINRGIRIIDPADKDPLYIFTDAENKPVYLFVAAESEVSFLFTDGESSDLKDDFIVLVPPGVVFNYNEMRSLVQAYKLGSKQFKIVIG